MKKFTFPIIALLAVLLSGAVLGQNITQVGSVQSTTVGGDDNITVTKPAGLAVGDVMIASIMMHDNSGGADLDQNASATGWTLIDGRLIGSSNNPEYRGTILYKVATASDVAATNFTFTLDASSDATTAAIVAFRGVDVSGGVTATGAAGGPFDVDPGVINNIATDGDINADAITTVTARAAVIMLGFVGNDPGINTNWTTASSMTELFDITNTNGEDLEIGAAWNTQVAAGNTGAGSVSLAANAVNGGILIALKPLPASATLSPSGPINIAVGGSVNLTAVANNYIGSGNYTFTWTATGAGGLGTNPVSQASNSNAKNLTYAVAGTYTVSVSIARSGASTQVTNTVTINVLAAPSAPNLWATSNDGNQVSSFSVNGGIDFGSGPTFLFDPFPSSATTTAALGRNAQGGIANGYFYWLPNTANNSGVVQVYGANATGGSQTLIGSLDLNGGSGTSLGFVRLGFGPDGTGWILAGSGTTLYLAKFKPNGVTLNSLLPAADQLTVLDASVDLTGGNVGTFQNGDICVAGDGNLVALANDGNGLTQIFVGSPNGASTLLTKKFDVLNQNGTGFTGSVNGVAFDLQGSLYVSSSDGLYYIDKNTVNGPAATISISQVWAGSGLQDLATNFFPTTIITPVKLGAFDVVKAGNNALLNWTTLTESNSDHFEIERSIDGINFSVVGTVAAAGNSTNARSYQFLDPINTTSKIIYYRLRTVDVDAKASMSKIVALRLSGALVSNFRTYPNPFTSDLKVQITSEKEADVTVRFSNALGQPVANRKLTLQPGENILVFTTELAGLQKGIYIMEVISAEDKQTQKIIKQ